MTESVWFTCQDSQIMLRWLGKGWKGRLGKALGLRSHRQRARKVHLFVAACCQRSTDGIPHPGDASLMTILRLGRGEISEKDFAAWVDHYNTRPRMFRIEDWGASWALAAARGKASALYKLNPLNNWTFYERIRIEELSAQCDLVRDIFGNPFLPVTIENRWLTSTVTSLARSIYDERAFDRMPILADALEEAGLDNPEVLAHCRAGMGHVRGCHVIDLLLEK